MPETTQTSLSEVYARFGAERPFVMKFAERMFTPFVLQLFPDIADKIDDAILNFVQNAQEIPRLLAKQKLNIVALAHHGFLPKNIGHIVKAWGKSKRKTAFTKKLTPIYQKDIENLELKDFDSLFFTPENKMQVAAAVVVAQVLQEIFKTHHTQIVNPLRQIQDPEILGTRNVASKTQLLSQSNLT